MFQLASLQSGPSLCFPQAGWLGVSAKPYLTNKAGSPARTSGPSLCAEASSAEYLCVFGEGGKAGGRGEGRGGHGSSPSQ